MIWALMRCLNLHKTFSTPHGGGGLDRTHRLSDAQPVCTCPFIVRMDGSPRRTQYKRGEDSFGRMVAFHGQMGMFVRALTYMLNHGADGLKQVAEDAVLNANTYKRGKIGHDARL